MQTSNRVQNPVNIVDLKDLARNMLPSSSMLRELILSEPDYLPSEGSDQGQNVLEVTIP